MAKNPQQICLRKRPSQTKSSPPPAETALSALPQPRKRRRTTESTEEKATLKPKIAYIASATTTDVNTARNQALFQTIPVEISPNAQFFPSKGPISSLKDLASDILQVCSSQSSVSTEEIVAEFGQKQAWGDCAVPNLARTVTSFTDICLAAGVIGKRGDCSCLPKSGNGLLEAIAQKKATLTHLCAQFMAIHQLIRRNFTTPTSAQDSIPLPLLLLATPDSPHNNLRISGAADGRELNVKGRLPFQLLSEGEVLLRLALPRCSPALTAQLLPHPDLQKYLPK